MKIIQKLASYATSEPGKAKCTQLLPSDQIETIKTMQRQTGDALSRLFKKGSVSFGGAKDIRASLKRLEIGSTLGIPELLAVCGLLENCARVKSYGRPEISDAPPTLSPPPLTLWNRSRLFRQRYAAAFSPKMKSAMTLLPLFAR